MSINVAMVEDNADIREHWIKFIHSAAGLKFVGACASAEEALERLPGLRPDVVLMDINLPGASGIECTARLKRSLPQCQILVVTVYSDNRRVFQALQAGASGYLLKRTEEPELVAAIRNVMVGGGPLTGEIARKLIEVFQQPVAASGTAAELTLREQEVLELLAQGYADKQIAHQLGISSQTVNTHLKHIYEKLHVRSRTEAMARLGGLRGAWDRLKTVGF